MHITHPFHPLHGDEIDVICRRRHWGEDRVVYLDESGQLRWLSAALTDIDPPDEFRRIAAGGAAFRTVDLLALWASLDALGKREGVANA